MKFLFVSPGFHNNQRCWVKTLLDKGHEVDYLIWRKNLLYKNNLVSLELIEESLFTYFLFNLWSRRLRIRKLHINFGKPKLFKLYKQIKEKNPDVVIARNPQIYLFSFFSLAIARLQKRKIIIYSQTTLHGKDSCFFKNKFIIFFIKIFNAKWITPILGEEDKYSKFHKEAYFVPFAIESPKGYFKDNDNHKVITIISVGKLVQKRKNNLLLLRALKRIKRKSDFHLTLIGSLGDENDSEFKKLQKYIKDNGLSDIVTIKKNVPYEEMFNEYIDNDIFVLPSSNEPFGYVVLEAMSSGLPVICSDTCGARWYIEEGKNGYIFKSNNLNDFIDKISLIISNKEKMKEMGEESKRMVEEKYSPEVFYEKLMEVIS